MAKSSTAKIDLSNVALEILEPNTKEYSFTLKLVPVRWQPDERRWQGIYYGEGEHMQNLQLRCYQNPEHPERECYAWYTEYSEIYSLDVYRVGELYKTLTSVEKGLEKARERDGQCTTFGHYVLRVARALGITKIIRKHPHYPGEYQSLSLADGQYAVDNLIFTWRESTKNVAAAD